MWHAEQVMKLIEEGKDEIFPETYLVKREVRSGPRSHERSPLPAGARLGPRRLERPLSSGRRARAASTSLATPQPSAARARRRRRRRSLRLKTYSGR
jgi:hypothetical protein